jgi:hypothetical protein
MKIKPYHVILFVGVLLIAVTAGVVTAQDPSPEDAIGEPPTFLTDIWEAWSNSPHARFEDEAFRHWDADGAVEEACARCHSTPGYADFLGADGSEAGTVDAPAALGSVINCDACHNSVATTLTSVTFPSGVEIANLNDAARCMVCHQGRASSVTVNTAIENAGLTEEPNTVSEELRFINIHYYAAAASLYGSEVHGGYEFADMRYQSRFRHVEGIETCIDCHNPHTLEVQVNVCTTCHEDVETVEDLRLVRMPGSGVDYDGDGDVEEGIAGEIETLQELLWSTIQAYAENVVGAPILHGDGYPYFFNDLNANGELDDDEATGENGYASFTPLLVQTVYNYQVSLKDPGNFAHNAKYHIELLVDSINMLNAQMDGEVDTSGLTRDDPGHFNTTREAFRHWDEDGEVEATCAKCHTAEGLPFFIEHGTSIAREPSDSLACSTCHTSVAVDEVAVHTLNNVVFPSGFEVSFGEEDPNNVCLNCHQGRESSVSVSRAIQSAGVGDDEVSEALRFRNPHYFAAGATLFGNDAMGGYQYEGKEYVGRFEHARRFNTCTDCHDTHTLENRLIDCMDCHEDVESKEDILLIRQEPDVDMEGIDYDGDGSNTEPIREEIMTLHEALFAAIQDYAANTAGAAIAYNANAYPYWYGDTNENGEVDEGEEAYAAWTPNLVRAVYNYLFVAKDPGSFAHNADYSMQLLYDSLESLGGEDAVANYTRPEPSEFD